MAEVRLAAAMPRGIAAKLATLVAFAALVLAVCAGLALYELRQDMLEGRIAKIRSLTETAHAMAEGFAAQVTAGQLSKEEALKRLCDAVRTMRYDGKREYIFIYDMDGVALSSASTPNLEGTSRIDSKDPNGKFIVRSFIETIRTAGEGVVDYVYPRAGSTIPVPKISYVKGFAPWNLIIGTGVYVDDIDAAFHQKLVRFGSVLGLMLAACLAFAWLLSRSITRPLLRLERRMAALAAGDLAVEIEGTRRADEIGRMARAVEVFRAHALDVRRLEAEQEEQTRRADADRRAATLALADEFERQVGGIVAVLTSKVGETGATARSMSEVAGGTAQRTASVMAAVEEATRNIQTVASGAEELSASIAEITRQVARSSDVARAGVGEAERTDLAVESLARAAQKIGEIVQLIQDIASQTNLLALNATIEAARAGDAGKGFAVVASEVKALAGQTAKATEEIASQIGAIQGATDQTVTAIRSLGGTIAQIDEIAGTIAAAVEQQSAATREIAGTGQQTASAAAEISGNVADVGKAAAETGSAAGRVLGATDELTRQGDALRRQVDTFLTSVRAA
jgi:methyl-accepting chemotaxis protein